MVTGYTANEYGDFLIASLQDPYTNTLKVIDWDISVGLKTPLMTGHVSGVSGTNEIDGYQTQFTTVFNIGDKIIIGNVAYTIATVPSTLLMTIEETLPFNINSAQYYIEPTSSDTFEYEYRWSQTNGVFSQFFPLNQGTGYSELLGTTFDTGKPVWIDIKAEVSSLGNGNTLTFLSVEYTIETVDGEIISCPNFCVECTDPFAMNGCANIEVSCDTNLFNPYDLSKSEGIYKQLTNIVTGIFGHEVNYFSTEPDKRTSDVILMEYSLHNVVGNENIKILVPDNEFPTEANTYDIFGIDLADFEVHITSEEFESHFGVGKAPRNKDYMFIPIINRMYEVSSISLADEFNKTKSYWRVKLVKYQDRSAVIKGTFDAATDVLTTGIDEIFGEQVSDVYAKTTKPSQFQSVPTSYRDGIREFVSKDLSIVDYELKNRWTVVSKNYYDLTSSDLNDNVITYDTLSMVKPGKNAAFTGWFSPQFDVSSTDTYYLFGDNDALISGGFRFTISHTDFEVIFNGVTESFTHGMTFDKNKWYAYIINMNNEFMQLGVSFYSLDPSTNMITNVGGSQVLPQDSSNNLTLEFNENRLVSQDIAWESSTNYTIRANDMFMTNIRVFDTPIEYEQHSNVLNQYVVRDNQHALIIDNAIPSLGFQRYTNAR